MPTQKGVVRAFVDSLLSADTPACIPWPFSVGSHGYGDCRRDGEHILVHRWLCEQEHGPPPEDGLDAAHSCGRDLCVNRAHLSWKTRKANHFDKREHGTHMFGETVPGAILTEAQAQDILATPRTWGMGQILADRYGVSNSTIHAVWDRRSWKHL